MHKLTKAFWQWNETIFARYAEEALRDCQWSRYGVFRKQEAHCFAESLLAE